MSALKRSIKRSQAKSQRVREAKRVDPRASSASSVNLEAAEKVQLNVRTQDEAAEVFVINADFQLVDRGVGRLNTFSLEPGIYRVKVRAGSEIREEHAVLYPGSKQVGKEFPALSFVSPAPLAETAKTHEYHMASAQRTSHQVHVRAGKGSYIFVFARDWTPPEKTNNTPAPFRNPARGLTLWDQSGRQVADFATQSEMNLHGDPCAGCNVQVDPGIYRLRLELAGDGAIEQTLVAIEDWQTQYFALQKAYGREPDNRQANLPDASILMVRKRGFHPVQPKSQTSYSEDLRLVELARLGLTNQRKVLSPQFEEILLLGKCRNPMLGIYGAHLLLLKEKPDLTKFRKVLSGLRELVGRQHPDVEALALTLGPDATKHIFNFPPMLRKSWGMVLAASVRRPELVPFGSFASQIADRMWGEEPWCLWMSQSPLASTSSPVPVFSAIVASSTVSQPPINPEILEEALLIPLHHFHQSTVSPTRKSSSRKSEQDFGRYIQKMKFKEEHYQTLVQTLGLPRANVEQLVEEYKRRSHQP